MMTTYRREISPARPLVAPARYSRARVALARIDPRITGAVGLFCVFLCCLVFGVLVGPLAALAPPALILLAIALVTSGARLARALLRTVALYLREVVSRPDDTLRPHVRRRTAQRAPLWQQDQEAPFRLRRPA